MAWQLHYTSARRGPTGRAGFQFVAETPGLPEGVRAGVTPYLAYRPPPGAPLSPDDGELGRFPVALLYDRVDGRALLLRCHYLGQDYSGRYGNFFAHAVVADPDELEGLRPAELWQAPLWTDGPEGVAELPELDDLTPDAAFAPDALADWLASAPAAHDLLALMIDAVGSVLGRGHGRVVLVSGDVERVARWIAVLSYSLPVAAAARMSFVTYSADPDGAAQRLVGTTPDVWAATAHRPAAHAFAVDGAAPDGADAASRFARTVAGCWREFDFAGLDALGELALLDSGEALDPAALDRAAALLALCRGDLTVTAEEEDTAAALLARHGVAIPEWVWRDLIPGVPSMGFDLALAVHDRARDAGAADVAAQCALRATILALADPAARERLPRHAIPAPARVELDAALPAALSAAPDLTEVARIAAVASGAGASVDPAELAESAAELARRGAADLPEALAACPPGDRAAVLDGVLRGLLDADAVTRETVLTDAACDLLQAETALLAAVPPVALIVLVSFGRRHPDRRVAVTGELLDLRVSVDVLDAALSQVWAVPPDAAECLRLLEAHAESFSDHPSLAVLPHRTFTSLSVPNGAKLAEAETLRLAARVRTAFPGGRAEGAALAVQAYADVLAADQPERAAEALGVIAGTARVSRLSDEAFAGAARRLARRGPRFRTALLAAADGPVRSRLGACWTGDLPGRPRRPDTERRNELMEVVLRLRLAGVAEPVLDDWARATAARWFAGRRLDAHFAGDRELRSALKDLLAEDRGQGR